MVDNNGAATAPVSGSKNLIVELDEKLALVEKRLSDIAGYQNIPPAIAEERESLQKRKDILLATRARLTDDGGAESGMAPQSTPPPPPPMPDWLKTPPKPEGQVSDQKPSAPPLMEEPEPKGWEEKRSIATFDRGEDKIKLPAEELESTIPFHDSDKQADAGRDADKLIGQNYSMRNDEEDGGKDKRVFPYNEEEEEQEESRKTELEEDITTKLSNASVSKLFEKVGEVIGLFNGVVESKQEHPDHDYLKDAIDRLRGAVDNLEKRARETKMNETQLKQAILGRAVIYINTAKAEFDFSGLLEKEIESKIKKILDEAK